MCLESYLDEQDELVLLLLAGPRQRVREQVVLGDLEWCGYSRSQPLHRLGRRRIR
jgi:hypothetical protein